MTPRKRILLTASAAVLALIALITAVNILRSPSQGVSSVIETLDEAPVTELPLISWPASPDARKITIRVDPKRGPLLGSDDSDGLQITPRHPAMRFSNWRVVRGASLTQVIGEGVWNDAGIVARWTFAHQNPQAYFSLNISKFPANLLRENIALKIAFPDGTLSLKAAASGMDAQAAIWLDELDAARLSVSNWSGNSLQAAGQIAHSNESRELLLSLWPASAHIESEKCDDDLSIDLEMNLMLSVGAATPVSVWPYADGADAALTPVFGLPAEHSDPQLAQAAAPDARRWLLRANTLIYGHSDPEDPRFGNGGLLGYGLGASVIIPADFNDDPNIQALAKKLEGTLVEIAPFDDGSLNSDAYPESSRALKTVDCAQLAALAERKIPVAIITQSAPDEAAKRPVHQGPADWPLVVLPEGFDGRLQSLRLQGFEPSSITPLLKEHRTRVFSSPFVATRNPLIGAAHESLLHPERDGHWTVSARLGGVMSNLEFWREESPLMVSSVAVLARHRAAIQQVKTWWSASKHLKVYNPTDRTIRGFTLAINGDRDATLLEGDYNADAFPTPATHPLSRRVLLAPKGVSIKNARTLIWWDLKPGLQQISIHEHGASSDSQAPQPITPFAISWEIVAP